MKVIPLRLPAELQRFVDTIRASEGVWDQRANRWLVLPPSDAEVIEKFVWEAYAKATKTTGDI